MSSVGGARDQARESAPPAVVLELNARSQSDHVTIVMLRIWPRLPFNGSVRALNQSFGTALWHEFAQLATPGLETTV